MPIGRIGGFGSAADGCSLNMPMTLLPIAAMYHHAGRRAVRCRS